MESTPKVTIITACYNGERFISLWRDSLLGQTYKRLEILVVNDGSQDASGSILKKCAPAFAAEGYEYHYFEQENAGIGPATNVGLRQMTGDYFMVYDIDDLLEPECVELRVKYLEKNRDCSLVLTDGWYANEGEINKRFPFKYRSPHLINFDKEKEDIFVKVLLGERGSATCPYMHRTIDYLANNPGREIYPTPYMQDTCLILLTSYRHKCGFLSDKLYTIINANDSHSHEHNRDWIKKINYTEGITEAIIGTLKMLPLPQVRRDKYEQLLRRRLAWSLNRLYIQNFEAWPRLTEVMIYGAGMIGRHLAKNLQDRHIKIECFFDNNPEKQGQVIDGIQVRSIDTLPEEPPFIILASRRNEDELAEILEQRGLQRGVDFMGSHECFMWFQEESLVSALQLNLSVID